MLLHRLRVNWNHIFRGLREVDLKFRASDWPAGSELHLQLLRWSFSHKVVQPCSRKWWCEEWVRSHVHSVVNPRLAVCEVWSSQVTSLQLSLLKTCKKPLSKLIVPTTGSTRMHHSRAFQSTSISAQIKIVFAYSGHSVLFVAFIGLLLSLWLIVFDEE